MGVWDKDVIPKLANNFKEYGINLSFILFISLLMVSVTTASADLILNELSWLIVESSITISLDTSFSSDFSRLSNLTILIRFLSVPSNFNAGAS